MMVVERDVVINCYMYRDSLATQTAVCLFLILCQPVLQLARFGWTGSLGCNNWRLMQSNNCSKSSSPVVSRENQHVATGTMSDQPAPTCLPEPNIEHEAE